MDQTLSKKARQELKRQTKQSSQNLAARRRARERLLLWGAVAAILLGVVGIIWKLGGGAATATFNGRVADIAPDDHIFGNPTTSTTLIEYSDFECPSCRAAQPFIKDLLQKHNADLRVVYRYFPLPQHNQAKLAAYAAEAAGKQGKFNEMHDLLFDGQDDWAEKSDARDTMLRYATHLNLNIDQFTTDLDSRAVSDRIDRDASAGIALGINSTPTFYLNQYKLDVPNFIALQTAVEDAINKK